MSRAPLLSLRSIKKRFGGVNALAGVDLDLHPGEIHALLGENGAGKSTLIKILGGIHQPDSGEMLLDGRPQQIRSVVEANQLGIRLIHQELCLAPNLSVAENIFLGREPSRLGFLDRHQLFADAAKIITDCGMPEIGAATACVSDLSVAQQQMVEIVRALSTRVRILILDEPTASLSESETSALFTRLRALSDQGVAVIYISHRLEEIRRIAHRVTVLRDGHTVGTQTAAELDYKQLIRWMVGRDLKSHYPRPAHIPGAVALSVRNLRNPKVRNVSFDLHYGEVLGFVGLVGAGRTELARALFGLDPIESGELRVDGTPVTVSSPQAAIAAGLALVPEDRKRQGLVMTGSVGYNLALPWAQKWIRGCLPDWKQRDSIVSRAVQRFGIRLVNPEQSIGELSGGNQQKVVVGKWMEYPPRILILDEPTRGVDVGAREEVFAIINELVTRGMAVILISSDLPEVMNLSHRLVLYRDGHIVREVQAQHITSEEVMAELTRN